MLLPLLSSSSPRFALHAQPVALPLRLAAIGRRPRHAILVLLSVRAPVATCVAAAATATGGGGGVHCWRWRVHGIGIRAAAIAAVMLRRRRHAKGGGLREAGRAGVALPVAHAVLRALRSVPTATALGYRRSRAAAIPSVPRAACAMRRAGARRSSLPVWVRLPRTAAAASTAVGLRMLVLRALWVLLWRRGLRPVRLVIPRRRWPVAVAMRRRWGLGIHRGRLMRWRLRWGGSATAVWVKRLWRGRFICGAVRLLRAL